MSHDPQPPPPGPAPTAAEEVALAYEPYLRMVVRRQLNQKLRARFDSHDVVQAVWADALPRLRAAAPGGEFRDASRLRAFLVRLTRHRFIDLYRRHRASLRHERPMPPAGAGALPAGTDPSPSEVVQAGDVWEQILDACPPAHHELLRLKARGAPLAEIARTTGLHESSVRRILYELAARLAADGAAPALSAG